MNKLVLFVIVGIMAFLCFGCNNISIKVNIEDADHADIYNEFDSQVMSAVDADTMKDLLNRLSNLSFKPTNEKMDYSTMLKVYFYRSEVIIASVSVDSNGVFYLNGQKSSYKVSSGSFDYEYLKNIYFNSSIKLNIKNADNVNIFYGFSSDAVFDIDGDLIKDLSKQLSNLSFQPTNEKMDYATMLKVYFYHDKDVIASVSVDKNGVFYINGTTRLFKVSSGTFDYEFLRNIYLEGKDN